MSEVKIKAVSGGTLPGGNKGFIRPGYFWIAAFVFCCLEALMVQKLVLPLVPEMHGGHGLMVEDATLFHEAAVEISSRIRANGWSEWSMFPTSKGSMFTANVGLLSALYAIFRPDPAIFIPLNAAAHVTGALMLYLIGPLLLQGRAGKLGGLAGAILFVVFPSALSWYTQNLKDAFAIAGTLTMLYVWLRLQAETLSRRTVLSLLLIAMGGGILLVSMRPYLAVLTAAGFACSWIATFIFGLIRKRERLPLRRQGILLLFMIVVGICAAVGKSLPASDNAFEIQLSLPESTLEVALEKALEKAELLPSKAEKAMVVKKVAMLKQWEWKTTDYIPEWIDAPLKKISELRVHFIQYAVSVGAGSGVDEDRMPSSAMGAVAYLPRALVVGLFTPFPDTWAERVSVPRLAVAVETFLWYLFSIGTLLFIIRRPGRNLLSGAVFCAALIVIYAYVNPNVGNLCRVRFGFWMFFLVCGAVGWASLLLPLFERINASDRIPATNDGLNVPETTANPEESMGRLASAGVVAMMLTFAGFLGFLARDLLLINVQGMAASLDVFFSAVMLPMVFVNCFALPMGDVITKPFLKAYQSGDLALGRQVIRKFLGIACLVMGCASVLVVLLAPLGIRLVLGTEDVDVIATGSLYLRMFAPIVFLSAWTVVGNCVLNSLNKSGEAAAAQLIVPLCTIVAILAAEPGFVLVAGLAGMVAGTFLNAFLLVLLCAGKGVVLWPTKYTANFPEPVMKPYTWLVAAAVFTAVAVPLNFSFASSVGVGSVSAWALASKIIAIFTGLFSIGVTAVVLPHLARMFEHQENSAGRDHFYFLVIAGTWLGGLIAVSISLFAEPLISALFSKGVSDAQILTMAQVLRIGAVQIPVAIAGAIVLKSVAVSGVTVKTVAASAIALAANVVVNLLLVPRLGIEGIAFGALAFTVVATFSLAIITREKYGMSFNFCCILLAGWAVWGWVVVAIHTGGVRALLSVPVGIAALTILHVISWKRNLHHRTSLRA